MKRNNKMALTTADYEILVPDVDKILNQFQPGYWFQIQKSSTSYWSDGVTVTGPKEYRQVANAMQNLYASNYPPFLYVKLNIQRALETGYITRTFTRDIQMGVSVSESDNFGDILGCSTIGKCETVETPIYVPQQYGTCNFYIKSFSGSNDYVRVGDWIQKLSTTGTTFGDLVPSTKAKTASGSPYFMFAHKSIVQMFPPKVFYDGRAAIANVAAGSDETPSMYMAMGSMFANTDQPCPAVLKPFLKYLGKNTETEPRFNPFFSGEYHIVSRTSLNRPDEWGDPGDFGLFILNCFLPANGPNYQVEVHRKVIDATRTVNKSILMAGQDSYGSASFFGFYDTRSASLNNFYVKEYMYGYCATDMADSEYAKDPKPTDQETRLAMYNFGIYPNICACLGRRGQVEALRRELGNEYARLECLDPVCLASSADIGVFRLPIAEVNCAPISLCKVNLDANKINLNNVILCGELGSDQPPAAPGPANATPPTLQQTILNFIKKNTILFAGVVIGIVILIFIVVVALVFPNSNSSEPADSADFVNNDDTQETTVDSTSIEGTTIEGTTIEEAPNNNE